MIRLLSILLVCSICLAGCAGVGPTLPATPVAVDARAAADRVNALRARHGLGPVRIDDRLMRAAERHALAMASRDRMSHKLSLGDTLPRRLSAAGYSWGAAAENIGAGYRSLEAALAGWEASAGHRKNLLLGTVTEIGIAAAHAPDTRHGMFWALVLAAPPPERPPGGWGMPM
jgi:uncharacterized protein YkwD